MLTSAVLLPLQKANGGLRPIAMGEVFTKLVSTALLRLDPKVVTAAASSASPQPHANLGCEYVGANQYGVGVSGGAEIIVHAVREQMYRSRAMGVLAIDFRNAYNDVRRGFVRAQLQRFAPLWLRIFDWSYGHDSDLLTYDPSGLSVFKSRRGMRQGDVLAPLFFAVAMRPLLETLEDLPTACPTSTYAYLDDVTVTFGVPERRTSDTRQSEDWLLSWDTAAVYRGVHRALERLHALAPASGLRVNTEKTQLFLTGIQVDEVRSGLAHSPFRDLQVSHEGLTLLGVPMGHQHFTQAEVGKKLTAMQERSLDRLAELRSFDDSHPLTIQDRMILLRSCVGQQPAYLARTVHLTEDPDYSANTIDPIETQSTTAHLFDEWDRQTVELVMEWAGLQEGDGAPLLCHLPVRLGGLGIRLMKYQADLSFTASVVMANYVLARMPSKSTFALCPSTLARIRLWWNAVDNFGPPIGVAAIEGGHPFSEEPRTTTFQKQLQTISDQRFGRGNAVATRDIDDFDRRALLMRDSAAQAAWVSVRPTCDSLTIPNNEYRQLLAARLLVTTSTLQASLLTCPLCRQQPKSMMPSHTYMCRQLSLWRKKRHDRIVDLLATFCPPDATHVEASVGDGQMKLDLIVRTGQTTQLAVDVTVVGSQMNHDDLGHTYRKAAAKKSEKYARFQQSGHFTSLHTFAINPFGSFSKEANDILKLLIPEPQLRAHARAVISVSAARGTARMMSCWNRRTHQLVSH